MVNRSTRTARQRHNTLVEPPERPPVIHSSLYLPESVYEALRKIAFDERAKIHDLVMEGIDAVLRRRGYPSIDTLKSGAGGEVRLWPRSPSRIGALLTTMAGDPKADWTVASTGYGWFVNRPDEPESFNPPMDLLAIWKFAALHGCQGVLFDADATIIPDLQSYDEKEQRK
jgi:hypothetical protein